VVVSQVFTARPSSIPDIRDFVRRCLAESPLTEDGNREVSETVFRALLDAAGPTGSIQVAFRIFPDHVEVDVLHSDTAIQSPVQPGAPVARTVPGGYAPGGSTPAGQAPGGPAAGGQAPGGPAAGGPAPGGPASGAAPEAGGPAQPAHIAAVPQPAAPIGQVPAARQPTGDASPATFAEWMSSALRREGLTQEAAARQLGVSVKTVSRWVGGATEPRMRDLRRIQEVFGEVPLP
jgi:DNA-binding XRE family transcriptional regulator